MLSLALCNFFKVFMLHSTGSYTTVEHGEVTMYQQSSNELLGTHSGIFFHPLFVPTNVHGQRLE